MAEQVRMHVYFMPGIHTNPDSLNREAFRRYGRIFEQAVFDKPLLSRFQQLGLTAVAPIKPEPDYVGPPRMLLGFTANNNNAIALNTIYEHEAGHRVEEGTTRQALDDLLKNDEFLETWPQYLPRQAD